MQREVLQFLSLLRTLANPTIFMPVYPGMNRQPSLAHTKAVTTFRIDMKLNAFP